MQIPRTPEATVFINTVLTKQANHYKSFPVLVAFAISQNLELPLGNDFELHYLDLEKSIVEPTVGKFIELMPTNSIEVLQCVSGFYKWRYDVATGNMTHRSIESIGDATGARNYLPKDFRDRVSVEDKELLPSGLLRGIYTVLDDLMPKRVED